MSIHGTKSVEKLLKITEKAVKINGSIDFEITRMISDQIALHSVQLPMNHRMFRISSSSYIYQIVLTFLKSEKWLRAHYLLS